MYSGVDACLRSHEWPDHHPHRSCGEAHRSWEISCTWLGMYRMYFARGLACSLRSNSFFMLCWNQGGRHQHLRPRQGLLASGLPRFPWSHQGLECVSGRCTGCTVAWMHSHVYGQTITRTEAAAKLTDPGRLLAHGLACTLHGCDAIRRVRTTSESWVAASSDRRVCTSLAMLRNSPSVASTASASLTAKACNSFAGIGATSARPRTAGVQDV